MSQPDTPSQPTPNDTVSAPASLSGAKAQQSFVRRLLAARESSVFLVLVIIGIGLYLSPGTRDVFYGSGNLQNLSRNIALLSIFAIGETIVIIIGGIDLSLGSLIAFSGMILAYMVTHFAKSSPGLAIPLAILLTLTISFSIGGLYATLIHRLRLPAFVVTLAALTILRSQALLLNNQLPITVSDFPFLSYLANGRIPAQGSFAVPVPVIIMAVIAVIAHLILTRTRIGRYVYSLGSNEQATRLSGVNVGRVKLFAYGASAVLGGVAGILYVGYGGQGDPLSGQGYELNAVAAAVIGGANLMGGQGSVMGTLLGATLLQVIITYINLRVDKASLWEGSVYGGVLLLAVLVTAFQQRRRTT